MSADIILAVAGNPNSGKTTLFNGLTGSRQKVGNWPGVTVEKKTGAYVLDGVPFEVVDLPGIYSLSSHSEDERIARDYLLSKEADLVLNIVDASNLERNLFLTLNLIEMRVPVVLVLNMVDLAEKRGIKIDPGALSRELDVPVIPIRAISREDIARLKRELPAHIKARKMSGVTLAYPDVLEIRIDRLAKRFSEVSMELGVVPRWMAVRVLEGDALFCSKAAALGAVSLDEQEKLAAELERDGGESADSLIAATAYSRITGIAAACRTSDPQAAKNRRAVGALDRVVLNRFWGIPIFLAVMYLMFWVVINVGGAFIDFFDISFGAVFVDGFGLLLERAGSPPWLVALLAGGIGAGIQTVATFVPIIFAMFFMLALLEDSGYMARAVFVMDRVLRAIGLP
ncbi:MAG TPA: ferrous iron transport protein B, partial [Magnetospirillaceae bacterium]|nr:ferrous iron transport protein B [Magnetospirillaceae bacterium]